MAVWSDVTVATTLLLRLAEPHGRLQRSVLPVVLISGPMIVIMRNQSEDIYRSESTGQRNCTK